MPSSPFLTGWPCHLEPCSAAQVLSTLGCPAGRLTVPDPGSSQGQFSFQGNQARSVREPREPRPRMCQLTALDLGPFWKCSESMTEYLTLMISAPLQGSDPKGPHLGAAGNHTWSEVLGISGSAPGHWGLDADSSWVPKGQPASSFQACLTERQGKVCCIGNVHSQPAVTALLRNSLLCHPGRLKHPGFPSQLQFKEAAW